MLSMQTIRRSLYGRGFRPKPGNIFHSPSLSWVYETKDSGGLLIDQHLSPKQPYTQGGVGDGIHDDTKSIQSAIDDASKNGGLT